VDIIIAIVVIYIIFKIGEKIHDMNLDKREEAERKENLIRQQQTEKKYEEKEKKMNSYEECINCGIDFLKKNDFSSARNAFDRAILKAGLDMNKLSYTYTYRGMVFFAQSRHTDAASDFKTALDNDSNNSEARQMLEKIRQVGDVTSRIMAENYLGYR